MRFASSIRFGFFRFLFIFASNFSQLFALNTVVSTNIQCEWRKTKSVSLTPINPPPHPNCPNLLERLCLKSDTLCVLLVYRKKQLIETKIMISFIEMHGFYFALLWIRDILVWIWIRGSRSLTYGSGSGSCFLCKWLTRCQQKISFFSKFFCRYISLQR